MPVPRERFREGITWDDWLERLGDDSAPWRERFDDAALGDLRAEYQSIPTPRFVACLFDPTSPTAREVVPIVARCCDQAAVAGGVDLRLFPIGEFPDLANQYLAGVDPALPVCVVLDRDWVQVGLWRMRADSMAPVDEAAEVVSGFLDALRGLPGRPWRGRRTRRERGWRQAELPPGAP